MLPANVQYAGFWKRFVAYLIDYILLGVASMFIFVPFLGLVGLAGSGMQGASEPSEGFIAAMVGAYFVSILAIMVAGWLYFALMESSNKRATLGKMALGLVVTDMEGNKISFGKATGRYFGKIISGIILYIGFFMAGFTERKQALHDMMAGCLVINKDQPAVAS